ncbi:MAG: MlaE family lipid ABC transporter permease subunit [Beijerinckiaceae bacterium]|jgi:phospholipid/cholesterol/gamma-HCH transport system permease protein|nr:MlaE family lipid ABC transporter permease subunit [Beijerinckiaceae bacterium]
MPQTIASPGFEIRRDGERAVIALAGEWTLDHGRRLERLAEQMPISLGEVRRAVLDIGEIQRLDTLGARVIDQLSHELGSEGVRVEVTHARREHATLLDAVRTRTAVVDRPPRSRLIDMLADIGRTVVLAWHDLVRGVSFIGEVVVAIGRALIRPQRFRWASLINQLEQIAFRGAPIIILITFLVGCIVAQQGIFQLRRFGATAFVVDLVGIITLRELALLLCAIMIAGRSGSAFTAEIGSMKMREEIDALRVMGLNPVDVLVVPRILALIIAMPILTFLGSMAGLFGAGLTAWLYGGIAPETFVSRLQSVITYKHFSVGLIKAPFMAIVIGAIACIEGLEVKGSAESLGQQVTASVVKAIFMVIVVDGLFAMFFASIRF